MAWGVVPVVGGRPGAWRDRVLKTQWDEVLAAINERNAVCGIPDYTYVSPGDGNQPRLLINNYRGVIETLIPYFCNPADNYAAWTKSTCLTAAIGAADWVANADPAPRGMHQAEINELRLVLNKLEHLLVYPVNTEEMLESASLPGAQPFGSSNVDWDTSWAAAKADISSSWISSFGPAGGPATYGNAYSPFPGPGGGTYGHDIYQIRSADIACAVPAAGTILSANVVFSSNQTGVVQFEFYEAANFAGVATVLTPASGYEVVPVAIPVPGTAHYSARLKAPVDYDDCRPADSDGEYHTGSGLFGPVLVLQYQFAYKS